MKESKLFPLNAVEATQPWFLLYLSLCLSLLETHTISLTIAHAHTHFCTWSHTLTHINPLTHTHALTSAHTHIHTCIYTQSSTHSHTQVHANDRSYVFISQSLFALSGFLLVGCK